MKNIVVFDEYNEIDLKPSDLLQKYLKLSEDDVTHLLVDQKTMKESDCPGCNSSQKREAFYKFGLKYNECENCGSLFISPRPDEKALNEYYAKSKSRLFFRDELSKVTGNKRKEKIIKPRFQWVLDSTQEYFQDARHWVDINTSQYGYIEEMLNTEYFQQKTLLNPLLNLEYWKSDQRVQIVNKPWWDFNIENEVDVISIFEVADQSSDIEALFSKLHQMLSPNGLIFMTAILASGFDLQVLWNQATNIYPPDRLNVFSVEGLKKLFERFDFECLEFSTPGILDVEIVGNAIQENSSVEVPRFIKEILNNNDENVKREFQEFLQSNLLSSYGRILLRKKPS